MEKNPLLHIANLQVAVEGRPVLHGLSMEVRPAEVHVIVGKNGAGKSSLAHTLAGHPKYQVLQGEMTYQGKNLTEMSIEERAQQGIFMTFQQPMTLEGIRNMHFLKTAVDTQRKARGEALLSPAEWLALIKKESAAVGLGPSFLSRAVNEGFSGGEKKRNELLQIRLLKPRLILFDEIDSGLDAEALQVLIQMIHKMRQEKSSVILITHYLELLQGVKPNYVHWIDQGNLRQTGSQDLATKILQHGYLNPSSPTS